MQHRRFFEAGTAGQKDLGYPNRCFERSLDLSELFQMIIWQHLCVVSLTALNIPDEFHLFCSFTCRDTLVLIGTLYEVQPSSIPYLI